MRMLIAAFALFLAGAEVAHAACTASELLILQRRGYASTEIDEACRTVTSFGEEVSEEGRRHVLDAVWQVTYRPVSCDVLPRFEGKIPHCPEPGSDDWRVRYGKPEYWKMSVTRSDIFAVVAGRARRACRGGTQFAEYERLRLRGDSVEFARDGRINNLRWEEEYELEMDETAQRLTGRVIRLQIFEDPETNDIFRLRRIESVVLERWPGTC